MKRKLNICLVSDFFLPQLGGVQVHIYQLAQELHSRGHKIIIVTHKYQGYVGVRWLEPGIKVYYLPHFSFGFNTIMPTYILTLPIAREILVRQEIDLSHSHQASSVLAGEFLSHSRLLGIRTVHTEHSLFGLSDIGAINLYKVAQVFHNQTDRIICVSRLTRENLRLRTNFPIQKLVVIPNSIRMQRSKPPVQLSKPRIIYVGRLYYRKGTDLLVDVIPEVVRQHPDCQITVIGNGPKKYLLQHVVKQQRLQKNVKLLGRVEHHLVKQHLEGSNIFLNISLTQSFGIAILQAAALGLICVSTDVGAVHEIMPRDQLILVQPNPKDIVDGINLAVRKSREGKVNSSINLCQKYSWESVGDRVQEIYQQVYELGRVQINDRIKTMMGKWSFIQMITLLLLVACRVQLAVLDWIWPRDRISRSVRMSR